MNIAVCIQSEETRALLSRLFDGYRAQRGYDFSCHFFMNKIDLLCDLAGGAYDVLFFKDGQLGTEIREKDRRLRLVQLIELGVEAPDGSDVWYCLPEPLSGAFLFPLLDRLHAERRQEAEAGLLVKNRGSVIQLAFSRIEFVEVMRKSVFFHLTDGTTEETTGAFSAFEARLLHWPDFVKVHRAFIVNLRYVQKLEPGGILTSHGHSVPVSSHIYPQFKKDYLCRLMDSGANEESAPAPSTKGEAPTAEGFSILLVDDMEAERQHWAGVLSSHGCRVRTAGSGDLALRLAGQDHFDCVVLDVNLGTERGFDLCGVLSQRTGAPVIFLSDLDSSDSQTQGFLSGGVDYITKDVTDTLFWLKVEKRIQTAKAARAELIDGSLRLDAKNRRVFFQGQEISLTAVEFDLLSLLMQHSDVVYTPARLYEAIWGTRPVDGGQAVQMHLSQLGRKLEAICPHHSFLETIWGKGYRFVSMWERKEGADEAQ